MCVCVHVRVCECVCDGTHGQGLLSLVFSALCVCECMYVCMCVRVCVVVCSLSL